MCRVTRVDRTAIAVAVDGVPRRISLASSHETFVVGDYVTLDADERPVLMPRRTQLVRASSGRDSAPQPLVANIDVVFVVVPGLPEPKPGMVERMLALVWDGGAAPVVVVTKCDIAPDPEGTTADVREAALGAEVLPVGTPTGKGLEAVRAFDRPGQTLCLLGRSGAGKSTLANALCGQPVFETQEVRSDGKGRHTTTHRELIELPGGAALIDTPGLRGVGVYLAEDGLSQAFPEIDELLESCRFSNCSHTAEPGCAVLDALYDGRISERRVASWHKLQREAEWMAARAGDRQAQAARSKRWRSIARDARSVRSRP